jgi:uncharacterized glyoxalase superfamily protein PhnB
MSMTDTLTAARPARPIPDGFHTITPSLTVHNAAEAIEFYKRAFGAEEVSRAAAPDGQSIWHAELRIGDSRIMLNDEFPNMGSQSPRALGGTPVSLHCYFEDTDAIFQQAVEAGATATLPPMDAFWGDRYARVLDPYGHDWAIATHQETVSADEAQRRAEAHMAECS